MQAKHLGILQHRDVAQVAWVIAATEDSLSLHCLLSPVFHDPLLRFRAA